MNHIETLKSFYSAMERHDWTAKRALLRDDFRFQGPLMQAEGADRFIEGVKQFNCQVSFQDVQMLEQGDTVMSFFTFQISQPFTGTFRMAERVTFRDGKLQASELIYDPRAFPPM
jgi:hypothetical protein